MFCVKPGIAQPVRACNAPLLKSCLAERVGARLQRFAACNQIIRRGRGGQGRAWHVNWGPWRGQRCQKRGKGDQFGVGGGLCGGRNRC